MQPTWSIGAKDQELGIHGFEFKRIVITSQCIIGCPRFGSQGNINSILIVNIKNPLNPWCLLQKKSMVKWMYYDANEYADEP